MPEDIMENVRLLEVVELIGPPDEVSRREASIGEMLEEHFVRNQSRNGNDLPPCVLHQHLTQAAEVGNRVGSDRQGTHALHELVASAAGQQLRLALEQCLPHGMLLGGVFVPVLVDGPIRPFRASGFAGGRSVFRDFY